MECQLDHVKHHSQQLLALCTSCRQCFPLKVLEHSCNNTCVPVPFVTYLAARLAHTSYVLLDVNCSSYGINHID